jgi:glycosyltransferase involved in cell wall biosynthesis
MRIAIDARFLGTGTGIGRYVEQLILNLEKIDLSPQGSANGASGIPFASQTRFAGENEYFILINKDNEAKYQPLESNFKKVVVNIPWYGLEEQIKLPKILKNLRVDLVHFPHFNVPFFYNQPFVISIHDLILTKYPSQRATTLSPLKYFFKNILYQIVIKHAVQKAQVVITMAEFTKKEIIEKFQVPESKVRVIYEGVTKFEDNDSKVDLEKYGINKNFILYVGNAYPHKNLEFLIKTWSDFKKDYQLVLVGKKDYFYERLGELIKSLNLENKIILTGYISDQELVSFYQQAQAYVFPSLCEGFGLPPLEAMQFSLPALVSNASCLPEILKNSVLYFCPQDQDDFLEKIDKIIEDEELRKELIINSQKLLLKYNWMIMAREILNIYKEL